MRAAGERGSVLDCASPLALWPLRTKAVEGYRISPRRYRACGLAEATDSFGTHRAEGAEESAEKNSCQIGEPNYRRSRFPVPTVPS